MNMLSTMKDIVTYETTKIEIFLLQSFGRVWLGSV